MADQGSQALLQADLDAKVTTNGANENTGLRVRTFLTNFIDTIYALIGRNLSPSYAFSTNTDTASDPGADVFRFNSATTSSVTEIAISSIDQAGNDKGTLNSLQSGILSIRVVGENTTLEFRIKSAVHTTFTVWTVQYLKGVKPANNAVCVMEFRPDATRTGNILSMSVDGETMTITDVDGNVYRVIITI